MTVAAVDGATVTLAEPLEFTHWGASETYAGVAVEERAEVGLLTHRIVVRGPADSQETGEGGHVMAHAGSTLRLEGVQLSHLGQSGTLGRYPVHLHMLGDAPASYVRSSSIDHSNQRCIALHATNEVLIDRVVAFDAPGHCFFLEDGVETGNRFTENLGLGTRPPAEEDRLLDSEVSPATYWISNPTNTYVGNTAAGAVGQGFWYDLDDEPGAASAAVDLDPSRQPMGVFDGNTAHSNASDGFETGMGLFVDDYRPEETARFTNFTGWKNEGFGVWLEHDVRLDGAVLADNRVGLLARDATVRDAVVVGQTTNAFDRPWQVFGVGLYSARGDVADVDLVNFRPSPDGRDAAAVHFVDRSTRVPSVLADLRFLNAAGLHWWDGGEQDPEVPPAAVHDTDGSLSGAPGLLVAPGTALDGPDCTDVNPGRPMRRCAAGPTVLVEVRDLAERATLLPASVVRSGDGQRGVMVGHDGAHDARAAIRMGPRHAIELATTTPGVTRVIASGRDDGPVEVTLPWTGGAPYVYRHWDHETPLAAAPSGQQLSEQLRWSADGSTVTLRLILDEESDWAALDVCAEAGCPGAK